MNALLLGIRSFFPLPGGPAKTKGLRGAEQGRHGAPREQGEVGSPLG